jgi:ABC-type multidrug transport system fused ATPase/permease subunit
MKLNLLKWRSELYRYGLTGKIIVLLMLIAIISTTVELISISVFLPLFETINPSVDAEHKNNIIEYMDSIYSVIGLSITTEILLITTFFVFLVSKIILFIGQYAQSYYFGLTLKKTRDRIMSLYLQVSPEYYDRVSIGYMTNCTTTELNAAVNGVMLPIKYLITLVSGIGGFIVLMLLSYKLTLLSLFMIFISILLPMRWVRATTQAGRKNSRYNSVIISFLLNRFRSPRLVRLSGTTTPEIFFFSALTEKQRRLTLSLHLLKARIDVFLEPVVIAVSLTMLYIALEVLNMPFSIIMLYLIIMVRMIPIVKNIMKQKQDINRARGPIESVNRIFDEMQKDVDKSKSNIAKNMLIDSIKEIYIISLKEVTYKYESSKFNALSNINLDFKRDTLTAIVGPSGSGKSTLIDIVSCFRAPTTGCIEINGVNSGYYSKSLLSLFVSFVPQDPQLFDGTIFSHISYGKGNATKEEVVSVAKLSGAYDFIMQLPGGFNYELLEGASNLSGGQRQRIDLARALLRDTSLLILDEPTSGLDAVSGNNFNKTIDKIKHTTTKTIIVISHNINHISHYEQIIVLESGVVTGVGNHNTLLSNNEWYKNANF